MNTFPFVLYAITTKLHLWRLVFVILIVKMRLALVGNNNSIFLTPHYLELFGLVVTNKLCVTSFSVSVCWLNANIYNLIGLKKFFSCFGAATNSGSSLNPIIFVKACRKLNAQPLSENTSLAAMRLNLSKILVKIRS